jgi:hypothetical protein
MGRRVCRYDYGSRASDHEQDRSHIKSPHGRQFQSCCCRFGWQVALDTKASLGDFLFLEVHQRCADGGFLKPELSNDIGDRHSGVLHSEHIHDGFLNPFGRQRAPWELCGVTALEAPRRLRVRVGTRLPTRADPMTLVFRDSPPETSRILYVLNIFE